MARGSGHATTVVAWLGLWLTCAGAPAQEVGQEAREAVLAVSLADVRVALRAVAEVEPVLADLKGPGGDLRAVRQILEKAEAAAGQPVARAVPWLFADNLAAGPYLQFLANDSVLVRWAAIESETTVRYGTGGKLTSTAVATRLAWPRWMHEAVLTGLTPGARYDYRIRVRDSEVGGTFRTPPAGDASFRFAVWGDSQCYPATFGRIADQMARQAPDLAVCTGDAVEVGLTDVDYYWELFRPARQVLRNAFLFSAVGNHELMGDADLARRHRFLGAPGAARNYLAFTYANCRFIVLDSNDGSLFGGAQLAWLKQELASDASAKARFRFLFLHHAPFCWDWYGGEQQVQRFVVPVAENGKVDVVFGGHFHCYERGARTTDGHQTAYVVNGGGAGYFTDTLGPGHHDRDFMKVHAWKHHFVLVGVDQDGLKVRAIDDKGEILDEFAVARPLAGPPSREDGADTPPPPAAPLAMGKPSLSVEDLRPCTISGADRDAALAAIATCRKRLAEKHGAVAYRLSQVAAMLTETRNQASEGAWTGPVERTAHRVPRLVNEGIHYRLKPSERADASVWDALDRIANDKLKGTLAVKGLDAPMLPLRWILGDSIESREPGGAP